MSVISARAQQLLGQDSPLVAAHFRAVANPWDAQRNPQGVINLGTAENHLLWDLIQERLASLPPLQEGDVHYAELYGRGDTRTTLAQYLSDLWAVPVAAEDLVIASGATAILDHLGTILCAPGEAALLAAPYYPGFDGDLGLRSQVPLIAVQPTSADFRCTLEDYALALAAARDNGVAVRMLLLCSPHNPLGRVYTRAELEQLLDFTLRENLHLVADELYAGSVFGKAPYTSVRQLAGDRDDVHVVYGMAKDLGLSGLKTGVLHTYHPQVRQAARALSLFAPVSTATQQQLRHLLGDARFVARLRAENQKRLAASRAQLQDALQAQQLQALPSEAGVYAWVDLRQHLAEPSAAAELVLFEQLVDEAGVNISPGQGFHCTEPGWFRLCHAQKPGVTAEGVRRVAAFLRSRA